MTSANDKLDLKDYPVPNGISDTQASEMIISRVTQCPDVKKITPNPGIGIVSLKSTFNHYTVEHKHERIRIRPKFNFGLSVILAACCTPFAFWFGYVFDWTVPFTTYALPLALLLIAFGAAWLVGFILGDNEQRRILKFIYRVLNGISPDEPVKHTKGLGSNKLIALIPLALGILVLVLFFLLRQ